MSRKTLHLKAYRKEYLKAETQFLKTMISKDFQKVEEGDNWNRLTKLR